MPLVAERVWETNSATGTSDFVLTGAKSGYRTWLVDIGARAGEKLAELDARRTLYRIALGGTIAITAGTITVPMS